MERREDGTFSIFVSTKYCHIYQFSLEAPPVLKLKYTGFYKKQVGLKSSPDIAKKIVVSEDKVFKILSDKGNVL